VVYIETDPLAPVPSSQSWWDVPVSETSALESTQQARAAYAAAKRDQKLYL
jgi:3D-(3,5/4)-trihydroxycyclohexane-1,2-dione acylhydrolase (decyclizing)